jgi:hypothetical protein
MNVSIPIPRLRIDLTWSWSVVGDSAYTARRIRSSSEIPVHRTHYKFSYVDLGIDVFLVRKHTKFGLRVIVMLEERFEVCGMRGTKEQLHELMEFMKVDYQSILLQLSQAH